MALLRRGRVWYLYYREGSRVVFVSLKTSSKVMAKHLHADFMASRAAAREAVAMRKKFPGAVPPEIEALIPAKPKPAPRPVLRVADMLAELAKIAPVSDSRRRAVRRFARKCVVDLMREVTPEIALAYLEREFRGDGNYKQFNNHKSALNKAFSLLLVPAGMDRSPFAAIASRRVADVTHHRPITAEEFRRIMAEAEEPYRTAAALGFYAGADRSTAFGLPGFAFDLERNLIRWKRPKTGTWFAAGIHRELRPFLEALKIDTASTAPVLPKRAPATTFRYFQRLFARLFIGDTAEGSAGFHSLRAAFFTRCDREGIHRRAVNLAGGHKDDRMTDLYSADVSAAHEVERLPDVLSLPTAFKS